MVLQLFGKTMRRTARRRRQCVDVLARAIADDAARSDIAALCERDGDHYVTVVRGEGRHVDVPATAEVARAVAYLEMRGRLARHPAHPELVRLL